MEEEVAIESKWYWLKCRRLPRRRLAQEPHSINAMLWLSHWRSRHNQQYRLYWGHGSLENYVTYTLSHLPQKLIPAKHRLRHPLHHRKMQKDGTPLSGYTSLLLIPSTVHVPNSSHSSRDYVISRRKSWQTWFSHGLDDATALTRLSITCLPTLTLFSPWAILCSIFRYHYCVSKTKIIQALWIG